jgi:hypothetical protein
VPDGPGEGRVEHAQHHGHTAPPLAELVPDGEAGLQIGQIVAGHYGHRGGVPETGGLQRLGQCRVGDDDRHAQCTQLAEPAVAFVLVHGHHLTPGVHQLLDDPGADGAEADHDDMPVQAGDPLPAERFLDAAADDRVGEHGEEHRDERRAQQHEADRRDHQPRLLAAEVIVAVADGGHRLNGEVKRGQQRNVSVAG